MWEIDTKRYRETSFYAIFLRFFIVLFSFAISLLHVLHAEHKKTNRMKVRFFFYCFVSKGVVLPIFFTEHRFFCSQVSRRHKKQTSRMSEGEKILRINVLTWIINAFIISSPWSHGSMVIISCFSTEKENDRISKKREDPGKKPFSELLSFPTFLLTFY